MKINFKENNTGNCPNVFYIAHSISPGSIINLEKDSILDWNMYCSEKCCLQPKSPASTLSPKNVYCSHTALRPNLSTVIRSASIDVEALSLKKNPPQQRLIFIHYSSRSPWVCTLIGPLTKSRSFQQTKLLVGVDPL